LSEVGEARTYYGRPLLKASVWEWYIPAYFVAGGIAGASSALAAATQLTRGRGSMGRLRRRSRRLALAAIGAGTVFLVLDLGRPERFANMLRVFRPSSPMSVGSWLLAAYGPAAGAAAMLPGPVGSAAGLVAGATGVPLAGYTGVLVAGTAVPAWQQAPASLPALFSASAVSGATSLLALVPGLNEREAAAVRRFSIAGRVAELAASFALERELGRSSRAHTHLRSGGAGTRWRAAHALTGVSLALTVAGRGKRFTYTAALTAFLGSLAVKTAVYEAGRSSAADPASTTDDIPPS
jgi:formate-dependent nitrite reductase membrane component NrfD